MGPIHHTIATRGLHGAKQQLGAGMLQKLLASTMHEFSIRQATYTIQIQAWRGQLNSLCISLRLEEKPSQIRFHIDRHCRGRTQKSGGLLLFSRFCLFCGRRLCPVERAVRFFLRSTDAHINWFGCVCSRCNTLCHRQEPNLSLAIQLLLLLLLNPRISALHLGILE